MNLANFLKVNNDGAAIYVRRAATVHNLLFLTFTLQVNILTGTFLLASCSNIFPFLLRFVHGQGQKR